MFADLLNVDCEQLGLYALQMLVAFALSILAGLNRERAHHLGLRTIPLVVVAFGFQSWGVAVILAAANFVILVFLQPFGQFIEDEGPGANGDDDRSESS